MGTEERKRREKEKRRELIIDAAEEVIRKKGFESMTMDDVAEETELSKGTLYLYFKNKSAIYLGLAERGSRLLNRRFAKVLTIDKPGLQLIRQMGEEYLDFVREQPIYFHAFIYYESIQDLEFLQSDPIAKRCEENARENHSYITRALQIGMQDGSIDDSYDAKQLAVMIWASSRGLVQVAYLKNSGHHSALLDDIELDIESMFKSFIHLLGEGMAKKE